MTGTFLKLPHHLMPTRLRSAAGMRRSVQPLHPAIERGAALRVPLAGWMLKRPVKSGLRIDRHEVS